MKARVRVMPRGELLDPAGRSVAQALVREGFGEVTSVRVGKLVELELAEADPARARARVEAMCRALLANGVVERYEIDLEG